MKIGGTSTDSALKTVTLWVYERTPENQQLHRKMTNGWEIIVAERILVKYRGMRKDKMA
jgi:hypothetical protein